MNSDLLFDFTVDKAAHTIFITREFDAGLALVWEAFTRPELLDRWGAPKPWTARTERMDFRVGGRRLYAMLGPAGEEFWSVQDFTAISPKTNIKYLSGFTDRDENIDPEFYGSENNLDFSEADGITTVGITIKYKTAAILQMMVEKGFREGTALTFGNLDELLKTAS